MKLIFLHGLGQDVLSWQGVQFALSPLHSKTFDIFSHPKESYQEVKERLMERLQQESEPFNSGRTLTRWRARSGSLQTRLPATQGLGPCQELNTNSTPTPSIGSRSFSFVYFPSMSLKNKMPINNR